ncbi:MAG TPA: type I DNA topoisomerase [Planctomycetes bacterium]|nr:type I DNA topoisomerase [Planctomycetota bacterium]
MAKNLVIVESPAKARTLSRFLGPDYEVEASIGHIRDLPQSASEIPEKVKKEKWARLGVDVENGFKPLYVIPSQKKAHIRHLKSLLKEAEVLYLATDEDREGESISWHLMQVLKPKIPVKRLVFHEITKKAILKALESPREIDQDLVRAQEARRIVDRLFGYSVSPLLWKKVRPRLSAGRVQSVAVRLIVERERERMAFHVAEYWDLEGLFTKDGSEFSANLVRFGDRRVASGKDFDPQTGQLKRVGDEAPVHLDGEGAQREKERLGGKPAQVLKAEPKPFTERPSPPFTTSTLQQDANRRLNFGARRTMDLAQRLYEMGYITYMRTDSTILSQEGLGAARKEIASRFGPEYMPETPRFYKSKVKNAQEAHEAIRPAGENFADPAVVEKSLGRDARRLYELILGRTLASQMKDAKGQRMQIELGIEDAVFQTSGKTYEFLGFHRGLALANGKSGKATETHLPQMKVGDRVETLSLEAKEHKTQPPARLTEATLVKELEARGIGRPSTYASIIETILKRAYVRKVGHALVPTFTAFAVTKLMEDYLSYLVDYSFTAGMEDELDQVSLGKLDPQEYLTRFFFGEGQGGKGLKEILSEVEEEIDPRVVCGIPLGEKDGKVVEVRVGRYGPFLSHGEQRAPVPEDLAPDELNLDLALSLLEKAAAGPRVVGMDPETGKPIYAKTGRFGPYVQLGDPGEGEEEKPKMASLLEGMDPETVTLEEAVGLLSLPRTVGKHPESGEEILAANGRYGPYISCGKETRSLPEGTSPLHVGLDQALALLAAPKKRGVRKKREPLKELGVHPETQAPVKILDGRFGPYVTDGTTNASLPRGTTVEEVTLDLALDLLKERLARGPAKKKKKKAARKASAKKASKKTSKKKTRKKK